jgi:5-methylcytosine-specific restriction enzyme subunit McrC
LSDSGLQLPTTIDLRSAVESQAVVMELSDGDAAVLTSLGTELASNRAWWGETDEEISRSVIHVERIAGSQYTVMFRDVVGLVSLSHVQIQIKPKIRSEHFLYLIERSDLAPRVSQRKADVEAGDDFVGLLARWCVEATEALLRQGLRQEYVDHVEPVSEVRGKLLPLETVMHLYSGRMSAQCEFDELSEDSALNRLLKGACERVAAMTVATADTRKRARQVSYRMSHIGPLTWADRRIRPDRLSANYVRACSIAQLILGGCGITTSSGRLHGTTFLVRTPEIVEDGLRNILRDAFPVIGVSKRKLMLGATGLSMSPDLVFGRNLAIGDVKYRHLSNNWSRSDLNQAVAFATAFGVQDCAVFGFIGGPEAPRPRPVPVGPVNARTFGWIASRDSSPQRSAEQLVGEVRNWIAIS